MVTLLTADLETGTLVSKERIVSDFHATFHTYWKQRTLAGRQGNTKKISLVKQ
jgi:hypothetical protein